MVGDAVYQLIRSDEETILTLLENDRQILALLGGIPSETHPDTRRCHSEDWNFADLLGAMRQGEQWLAQVRDKNRALLGCEPA